MSPAVFVDANIPIYAAGRAHPLKEPCARILELIAGRPDAFVSDAEVVQELLHRYLALRIWDAGRPVAREFMALMAGRLEAVLVTDVEGAMRLADGHRDLSARDLLHAAVMRRLGATRIVSADAGFDRIGDIERLDPVRLARWSATIEA